MSDLDHPSAVSTDGPATTIPATGQVKRTVHGGVGPAIILIAAACMPILGSTSIAPIQPSIVAAHPDQAGVDTIVSMILTMPALIIGLTAFSVGRVIDVLGRKPVLAWSLLAYAVFGTAPLYLPTLTSILVSRVLVGFTEAAIWCAATALIADYFFGARRAKYYGLMNMATGLAGVVFIGAAGTLGQGNWRMPFWLYALALPIGALAFAVLPKTAGGRAVEKLPPVDWRRLLRPITFTFIGGIIFYIPVSMLAFTINDVGTESTATIGIASAIAAVATAVGAGTFHKVLARWPRVLAPLAFGLLGLGLTFLGTADNVPEATMGAVIANLGGGFLIPTLQNWSVQAAGYEQRGRASGAFTSGFFIGQFLGPTLILGAIGRNHLGTSMLVVGLTGLIVAAVSVFAVAGHIKPNEEAPET